MPRRPKMKTEIVRRVVCRTETTRVDGEFWVKAYDQGNNRFSEADYFTDDREDATLTAREMVNLSLQKPRSK